MLTSQQSAAARPAKLAPSRTVYPYSIIRGGAYSAAELTDALLGDPVVARHYAGFTRSSFRVTQSAFAKPVYLSYRIGNNVYWTSQPVRLPPGETLLTDGQNYARARCGNRISQTPQTPLNATEPEPETMNTPQPPANAIADIDTWSEDRLLTFESLSFIQLPGQPGAGFHGCPPGAPSARHSILVVAGVPQRVSDGPSHPANSPRAVATFHSAGDSSQPDSWVSLSSGTRNTSYSPDYADVGCSYHPA